MHGLNNIIMFESTSSPIHTASPQNILSLLTSFNFNVGHKPYKSPYTCLNSMQTQSLYLLCLQAEVSLCTAGPMPVQTL